MDLTVIPTAKNQWPVDVDMWPRIRFPDIYMNLTISISCQTNQQISSFPFEMFFDFASFKLNTYIDTLDKCNQCVHSVVLLHSVVVTAVL